ncbi:MAG: precorrin-2 dehydrogenase/sirohydrochlorin ferrochelatase family protein [Phycisphaerae bacterium]
MNALYPIFLHLAAHSVLIVGGGAVGLRKAEGLAAAGAAVTVLSPEFHAGFDKVPAIERIVSTYPAGFLTQAADPPWRLVFAATNSGAVNTLVMEDAATSGVLCCRCDEPTMGDFILPATQRRGPVTMAVTSAGAAPRLSWELARNAAATMDPVLLKLVELSAHWRTVVLQNVPDGEQRRKLLRRLSESEMRDRLRTAGESAAASLFQQWLAEVKVIRASHFGMAMDARK